MLKILIIRNDKIGDFMLAWPSFALLKSQYPQAEITALVPEYTSALAEQCEWIDKVLIDKKQQGFFSDVFSLLQTIRKNKFDISISFFSEGRTAIALFLAGVKKRVGPATKIAQFFLNSTLRQKRSQSLKPEYEYNLDLVRFLISKTNTDVSSAENAPFMTFDCNEINSIKNNFIDENNIADKTTLVFIHPGSGGSAINLSLQQYATLAINLAQRHRLYFVITAGPDELNDARKLSALLKNVDHCIHHSTTSIIEFCKLIAISDMFISGSTGPLHIAGALNIYTVAFYPARQSATALRWQTINAENRRLAFFPDEYTGKNDMQKIDIDSAALSISKKFLEIH